MHNFPEHQTVASGLGKSGTNCGTTGLGRLTTAQDSDAADLHGATELRYSLLRDIKKNYS